MPKVPIAIAGIGNAASAFVQFLAYYQAEKRNEKVLGGLSVSDIEVVAAFDVTEAKVGKDLSEAIFAEPNNCPVFVDVPETGVIVQKGPVEDGVGDLLAKVVKISDKPSVDVAQVLKDTNAEILINLLPSGVKKATEVYAQAAIDAECAFVQCSTHRIASSYKWARKFKKAGLPVAGDDLQSKLGGTRIHKGLLELLDTFGARIVSTYQLDVSGGAEGLNTLDPDRRYDKRFIKTETIRRTIPYLTENDVVSGTTDFLEFMGNNRTSYFWIDAKYGINSRLKIDITIKSTDGPNAAETLIDVVRGVKLGLDRGIDGPLISVSVYGFKYAPVFVSEATASKMFSEFVEGHRLR